MIYSFKARQITKISAVFNIVQYIKFFACVTRPIGFEVLAKEATPQKLQNEVVVRKGWNTVPGKYFLNATSCLKDAYFKPAQ